MAILKDLVNAAVSAVTNAAANTSKGGSSGSKKSSSSGSSYRGLDSSGNDYASMVGMSDLDKAALEAAGSSWDKASAAGDQAGMDAAHKQAEAIRNKYGYSGGSDGSQYLPFQTSKREEFSYSSAPTYTSKYQDQIDELTEAILNREAFTYDPETDPTYQQYKESYTRSGERAMQDTLGQVSARTGGLASSYAGSAAQQTYDGYMAALADKIPELRQLAYSMYMDEGNTQRANLEMLMALEQGDYAKYQDLLGQYNTDRSFDYGVYRDDISDNRYDMEWNYQMGRDQIADQRYDDETAYNREQDEWEKLNYTSEREYEQALAKAQTLAAAGDFSGYKALGYTDAEIANLKSAYDKAQAAALLSQRSSSSGGSSSSKGSSGNSGAQDYDGLFAAAQASGHAKSFIANNYKKYGFSSSSGLYDDYEAWEKDGGGGGDENYTISNRHGYDEDGTVGWIYIPGHGRFSVQEVYNYVESGQIKETIQDDGTIRYTWVNKK